MYQPALFQEHDIEEVERLIKANPLGLLVTNGNSGLLANPIPFQFFHEEGKKPVLRCHVAKANAQWKEISSEAEVLVIFQGFQHYVHPGWYPTKKDTGKVVPTWNYTIAQLRGTASVFDDKKWLSRQIGDLTDMMEEQFEDAWSVNDAPPEFIQAQIRAIMGIEVTVNSIEGKWKVSQNRNEADRQGVCLGLDKLERTEAHDMAALIREKGIKP